MSKQTLIAVPDYGGSIRTECVRGLLRLTRSGLHNLRTINCPSIHLSRNIFASTVLEDGTPDVLFVDSDIGGFGEQTLLKLRSLNAPVCGVVYSRKLPGKGPAATLMEPLAKELPVKAKMIGLGFCLVQRKVFETLAPHVRKQEQHGMPNLKGPLYGFFDPLIENTVMFEEDYSFCARCSAHGIGITAIQRDEVFHVGDFKYRL